MINIHRANKAMHKIDPNGEVRWYISGDGCDHQIEGHISFKGTCVQATAEIYSHMISFDKPFKIVYNKLMKIKKILDEAPNE